MDAAVEAALGTVCILQLVDARAGGGRPMGDVLDEASLPWVAALGRAKEGRTVRLRDPQPSGSLAWLTWIVARHGGNLAGARVRPREALPSRPEPGRSGSPRSTALPNRSRG